MVYGAIEEKDLPWYTDPGRVFQAIGNRQLEYNWLITDLDGPARIKNRMQPGGYCWLSGRELTALVREDGGQWRFAVLSGFPPDIPLEEVLRSPLPRADGYEGFWKNPLTLQHPLAQTEIVPWDGCLTLVLSREADLVAQFRSAFPGSQDLAVYNSTP